MADIDVRRVHNLGMDAARRAAERLAADLGREFGLRGNWTGNVLHFERPGVAGFLEIDAQALHLSVSLGILLKAMKASIERAVFAEIDRAFPEHRAAPAKPPARSKTAKARPKKGG